MDNSDSSHELLDDFFENARGIIRVTGKVPPTVIDENTTFADFYEEMPPAYSMYDVLNELDAKPPSAEKEFEVKQVGEEISHKFEKTFLALGLRDALRSHHVCNDAQKCDGDTCRLRMTADEIDGFLTKIKKAVFKGSKLEGLQDCFEKDETGAEYPSTVLLNRFLFKSQKETHPKNSMQCVNTDSEISIVQHNRLRNSFKTVRFVQCEKAPVIEKPPRRFITHVHTHASIKISLPASSPTTRAFSHKTDENRFRSSPTKRQNYARYCGETIIDPKPNEGTDRRPCSGFQTAAEALAETNARMGIKPTFKRQGLSKIMYNPPFARPEQPAPGDGKPQPVETEPKHKKQKTDDEPNPFEGLPSYLLTEDGTALLPRVASCDPKLLETVCREIMDLETKVTWDDIAGLKTAKDTIEEVIIWPLLRPDIFTGLRGPPKGILLFGPPGTGKTLLARAVASQTGCTFFNISSSSLMSKWIGDGEKMVRCLFAIASVRQPSVVFIDEIDSLLSARTEGEQDAVRRIKTEFLVQLDGAATESTDRVLVIGATNRPEELDEAARRRLERRLYIALPDEASRSQIISHLLRKEANSLRSDDMRVIVDLTAGYSGADMKALCREAAMRPLRECHSLKSVSVNDVRPIELVDFRKAVLTIRPTVSDAEICRYKEWNEIYGSAAMTD